MENKQDELVHRFQFLLKLLLSELVIHLGFNADGATIRQMHDDVEICRALAIHTVDDVGAHLKGHRFKELAPKHPVYCQIH
ncbi:hypothetical protein [Gordonia humi]|uniref:Uncharacterized protein n=1 Tax=Gordonia humi TaxID=686429 RepID=A0A840EV75_9ACTN|nr:hypothetical protein [Gordonia humi]MBB4134223.1 hypothetical protein [Gordonia humi]